MDLQRYCGYVKRLSMIVPLLWLLTACATNAYNKASQLDTIEAYRQFIAQYPDDTRRTSAERRVEELEFLRAKTLNTAEALHRFLATYPNSVYTPEATSRLEDFAFAEAKANNTVAALEEFLSTYPASAHVQEARALHERLSFNKAKQANTIGAYEAFLRQYPDGHYAQPAYNDMVRLHYHAARDQATIESLQAFVKRYPESPWAKEARQDIERLRFQHAQDKHSIPAMQQYVAQYPQSPFLADALKYIDFLKLEQATSNPSISSLTKFIEDNPNNAYLPEAQALLSKMKRDVSDKAQQSYKAGVEYLERGLYSRASDEFRNAIAVLPAFPEAHAMLAVSLIKKYDGERNPSSNDLEEAAQHAEKALQINPQFSIARQILDVLKVKRSRASIGDVAKRLANLEQDFSSYEIDEIVQDTEKILRVIEEDANAWFLLGVAKILREVKKKERGGAWSSWNFAEDGRRELERAIRLKENFADAHLWLGAVLAREGFEQVAGSSQVLYYLNQLYHLWRNGWSNDWYRTQYITALPYTVQQSLDKANKEWQRAIALDYKMREVFKKVITRIFAELE